MWPSNRPSVIRSSTPPSACIPTTPPKPRPTPGPASDLKLMMAIGTGGLLDVAIQQAERYPFIYATIGVHPHDAAKATPDTWARLRDLAGHPKVLAIGEIGLDYHYDFSPRDVQPPVFARQLEIAAESAK